MRPGRRRWRRGHRSLPPASQSQGPHPNPTLRALFDCHGVTVPVLVVHVT